MIESGMALDYQGREIIVPEALFRKLPMLEGQETLAGKRTPTCAWPTPRRTWSR